jgi:branched-subunit amino acid aminotransferase/4-amino-4-deoxychorismate lyase
MSDLPDPRNADIQVWVGDGLKPRIYDGKVADLDRHLDRMFDSAHAMAFQGVPSREEIKQAVFATLHANGMYDGAHIRLTLTRGLKVTSGMSPHFNQSGCTLIVLAEWKAPVYDSSGIRLITSSIRTWRASFPRPTRRTCSWSNAGQC